MIDITGPELLSLGEFGGGAGMGGQVSHSKGELSGESDIDHKNLGLVIYLEWKGLQVNGSYD